MKVERPAAHSGAAGDVVDARLGQPALADFVQRQLEQLAPRLLFLRAPRLRHAAFFARSLTPVNGRTCRSSA